MWVEFVDIGFPTSTSVFLPSEQPTLPDSNSIRIKDSHEYQLKGLWLPLLYLLNNNLLVNLKFTVHDLHFFLKTLKTDIFTFPVNTNKQYHFHGDSGILIS